MTEGNGRRWRRYLREERVSEEEELARVGSKRAIYGERRDSRPRKVATVGFEASVTHQAVARHEIAKLSAREQRLNTAVGSHKLRSTHTLFRSARHAIRPCGTAHRVLECREPWPAMASVLLAVRRAQPRAPALMADELPLTRRAKRRAAAGATRRVIIVQRVGLLSNLRI